MNTLLSRDLLDNEAIENVVERLTGQPCSLQLDKLLTPLEAHGITWKELDQVASAIFDQHNALFFAAFYAGYMVGRNPDLLILAAVDGGDGAQ